MIFYDELMFLIKTDPVTIDYIEKSSQYIPQKCAYFTPLKTESHVGLWIISELLSALVCLGRRQQWLFIQCRIVGADVLIKHVS